MLYSLLFKILFKVYKLILHKTENCFLLILLSCKYIKILFCLSSFHLLYFLIIITYFRLIVNNLKQVSYNNYMNRLKELRIDKKLSQKNIAELLHMSQTGYSKYETEENDIPTKILIELSKFYDVTVGYLLGVED